MALSSAPFLARAGVPTLLLGLCLSVACEQERPEPQAFFFVDHVHEAEAHYDRARFLSFRKDGLLSAPVTLQGETRRALTPPLPSRLSFTVPVPRGGVLRFAIAAKILGTSDVWPPIRFILACESAGQNGVLFSERVDRTTPKGWLDREVSLQAWSGSTVRLTFETKIARPSGRVPWTARRVLPLWASPVVVSASRRDVQKMLLISVDCLRPDHMGVYGYKRRTTPHIDALAQDGVVFESAIGTSSWTLPTHMSMLTGLPPSLHGASKWEKLDISTAYLPEFLARRGLEVDGVASWVYLSQAFGFERGFHIYRVLDQPPAGQVVDEALDLLRRAQGADQFLFLHFFDPHWPYLPPAGFLEKFGPRPPDISDLLDVVLHHEPPDRPELVQQAIDLYDAEIAYTDQEVGRLIAELKKMGLYDRSLIILTADHGEAFWEHQHWQHGSTLYDELIRVPLIVKWPGARRRGRFEPQVSQTDIFATLLAEAGITPRDSWGVDLGPQVGGGGGPPARYHLLSEMTWRSPSSRTMKISLRSRGEKYIATLAGPPGADFTGLRLQTEELYDLSGDPAELKNTRPSAPARMEAFRRKLRTYLEEAARLHAQKQGEAVILDASEKEQLRKLGYIVQ